MSFLVDRILTSGGNRDSFLQKEHDIECEKMHGHSEDTIVDDFVWHNPEGKKRS